MTGVPEAPVNVRLVHDDGAVVPLELVYGGQGGDGIHVWLAPLTLGSAHADAVRHGRAHLQIDGLSGRTAVVIAFEKTGGSRG